jgi:outer membrane protein OmpA-like peptidoglycan-associated protein
MKGNILGVFMIIYSCNLFGQGGERLGGDYSKYYSRLNAETLIKQGKFVLAESCGDFRKCKCADSLSKKYHFIRIDLPFSGSCMVMSKAANDTIRSFNDLMYINLTRTNGVGWRNNYESEVFNCSEKICCKSEEIDSFLVNEQFKNGILFDFKNAELKQESKCILDNTLIPVLVKYPTLEIMLSGYCTYDESELNILLSEKRALNVQKYLVSKGISKVRIEIENNGYGQGDYPKDPKNDAKNKVNFIRKNRIVTWRITKT